MELILLFIFLFITATFVLAIRGLVAFVQDVKRNNAKNRSQQTLASQSQIENSADLTQAIEACHKLKELAQRGDISVAVYNELRNAIEQRYGRRTAFPDRRLSLFTSPQESEAEVFEATVLDASEEIQFITEHPAESSVEGVQETTLPGSESVEPVDDHTGEVDEPIAKDQPVAPWDVPDLPKKESRPWKELLAGFMQEKNIRWGELASGILIVGSAVGLVVSLRNELRETIPYFPALMFMLITAAIHGAGIYTLKKWNLRNTSRGVLLIGLLLVPLNFLAACILTGTGADQRELSDPVYWLAIGIGVTAFSVMTWFATQSLLSRRYIALFVSVMAGSVWMLVINRVVVTGTASTIRLAWALPFLLAFSAGTGTAWYWLRTNRYVSPRSVNRAWLMLGISLFVFLAGIALFLTRSPDRLWTAVALTPLFAAAAIIMAWVGSIVWRAATTDEQRANRIVGTALLVLGLSLAIVSLIVGFANPIVLVLSAAVVAVIVAAMSLERRLVWLWPAVWISLAISVLTAVSLGFGTLPLDAIAGIEQFTQSIFSSRSGITLMLSGLLSAGVGMAVSGRLLPEPTRRAFKLAGNFSSGVICLTGCFLAVVASFVYPENRFDMLAATTLLAVAALGITAVGTWKPKEWLPWCAAGLMFAFLGHALFWNGGIANWTVDTLKGIDARWHLLLTLPAILFAICGRIVSARFDRTRSKEQHHYEQAEYFAIISLVLQIVALVASTTLLRHQVGLATGFAIAIASAAFVNAFNLRSNLESGPASRIFFSLATLTVVSFGVAEYGLRSGWFESLRELRYWLIQICAAAAWCVVWLLAAIVLAKRKRAKWLLDDASQFQSFVLYALPMAIIALICTWLIPGIHAEFSNAPFANSQLVEWLSGNLSWLLIAAASVFLVHAIAMFLRPNLPVALSIVSLLLAACAFAASEFEQSRAVVTSLRWSLPIGGLLLAIIISSRRWYVTLWQRARRFCGLSGRSSLVCAQRQQVVNWSVFVVVGTVLLLSTITISIVMLLGKDHLGGPLPETFFGDLRKDLSFGGPVALIVSMLILYAISQRRSLLAVAGSCVFQYIVLLSIILLFLSPHPKLASEWFVNILQAVAIGMAAYGIAWFHFRHRVGSGKVFAGREISRYLPTHISLHTLLNVFLLTSLVVLIIQQYFFRPVVSAGWIRAAGGPLGYLGLVLLTLLCGLVWRKETRGNLSSIISPVLLAVTAMVATSVDKFSSSRPWWGFNTILVGSFLVAVWQLVIVTRRARINLSSNQPHASTGVGLANVMTAPSVVLTALFAIRGATGHTQFFWWYLAPLVALVLVLMAKATVTRSAKPMWIATLLMSLAAATFASVDPDNWLQGTRADWINVQIAGLVLMSIFCTCVCLFRNRGDESRETGFALLPNIVSLAAPIWILFGATIDWLNNGSLFDKHVIGGIPGLVVLGLTGVLLVAGLWNQRARFRFDASLIWLSGIAVISADFAADLTSRRVAFFVLFIAIVFACFALARLNGSLIRLAAARMKIPLRSEIAQSIDRRMPAYQLLLIVPVLLSSLLILLLASDDLSRVSAATTTLVLAFCFAAFAGQASGRWMQLVALGLLTTGIVFLSWTPLSPDDLQADALQIPMRTLLAVSAMMFALAVVLPRYLSSESVWRRSIRECSVATCVVALISFAVMLGVEFSRFVPDVGCGTPLTAAVAVSLVVLLLIAALILIAVRPKLDPFALSDNWRKGYVYAAQVIALMLLVHAIVSMPYLFQIGLRDYWPYILMIVAFGGIAMSQLLKRRDLQVLSDPLFHTTAILPIAAAVGVLATDSLSDPAMVMLLAGSVYLAIGVTGRSLLWGALAVVFGNFALWLFYGKFPSISFMNHPQLWLIPPALSVLVAAQLNHRRLNASQLAAIRYVCVAVIYVSSTSEIFIQGLGTRLWPPMILALLSVAGMFLGMMFRVRAYLYLGSLFLLLSVISMVAHAQQRLGHTWPWWAFGIGLGIVILTIFGLFEKRRNEMKAVAGNLREWDW